MSDRPDTNPLRDGPPVVFSADERTALVAMALGTISILAVMFLGLRCAMHRVEATLAFLMS